MLQNRMYHKCMYTTQGTGTSLSCAAVGHIRTVLPELLARSERRSRYD